MEGWVKLHRSMIKWEWYGDPNVVRVFLELLLRATHKDTKYRGHAIKAGSVIYGHTAFAEHTGLSVQNVRTAINKLKSTNEVTIKPTNKFSIISIVNWKKYQDTNKQDNKPLTGDQQATNSIQECKEITPKGGVVTPEKALFDYGKQILGSNSGGVIQTLRKAHGPEKAFKMIEEAANKSDPMEYIQGAMKHNRKTNGGITPQHPGAGG